MFLAVHAVVMLYNILKYESTLATFGVPAPLTGPWSPTAKHWNGRNFLPFLSSLPVLPTRVRVSICP